MTQDEWEQVKGKRIVACNEETDNQGRLSRVVFRLESIETGPDLIIGSDSVYSYEDRDYFLTLEVRPQQWQHK